ncbi:hypothetical protein PINS_up000663 [Pythium insidiosum]|nr:hypothetical protein PINS_up000663 [Pythium insidiosum]
MFMRSEHGALRIRKEVNELHKGNHTSASGHVRTRVDFPDGINNMLQLIFFVSLDDSAGPYANGDFTFTVQIPPTYPFHPPTVMCLTRIWHPNIDVASGHVMMAILGKDWRPVLDIKTVLLGLQLMLIEPGVEHVMNRIAAEHFERDRAGFHETIQQILCGGDFFGYDFPEHPRRLQAIRQSQRLLLKRSRSDVDFEAPENTSSLFAHDFPPLDPDEAMLEDPPRPAELFPIHHTPMVWKRTRLN